MFVQGYFTKSVPCVTESANILHIHPKYNFFGKNMKITIIHIIIEVFGCHFPLYVYIVMGILLNNVFEKYLNIIYIRLFHF